MRFLPLRSQYIGIKDIVSGLPDAAPIEPLNCRPDRLPFPFQAWRPPAMPHLGLVSALAAFTALAIRRPSTTDRSPSSIQPLNC